MIEVTFSGSKTLFDDYCCSRDRRECLRSTVHTDMRSDMRSC